MIAEDLPAEIALRECKLNIEHQYNRFLAYMLIDMPISMMVMEISLETLKLLSKDKQKDDTLGVDY